MYMQTLKNFRRFHRAIVFLMNRYWLTSILQIGSWQESHHLSLRMAQILACEQAHLFGVSREYLGGAATKASRPSRREEWGEEK